MAADGGAKVGVTSRKGKGKVSRKAAKEQSEEGCCIQNVICAEDGAEEIHPMPGSGLQKDRSIYQLLASFFAPLRLCARYYSCGFARGKASGRRE